MIIDFKYVFIILWACFTFVLVCIQVVNPQSMQGKWDWKNPREQLMVASITSWIMIFFAKGYGWVITL